MAQASRLGMPRVGVWPPMLNGVGRLAQLLKTRATNCRLMVTAADVEGILRIT